MVFQQMWTCDGCKTERVYGAGPGASDPIARKAMLLCEGRCAGFNQMGHQAHVPHTYSRLRVMGGGE